ncbi:SpoIIE family protein phosphatase [Streptomyces sp. LX-29]|uniref:SpoIIE family protein phosphatase n=1 Tax=Streptomyces sp. LX-29 TaxID=2900152 RepID=UPI00240D5D1D|nr:SpoIIE family protein phosphatase [Streptomyces sp. LX-29]WFB10736.1 SpoIIE family protein phosphatase [Streptomyces sp. LX-29]
MGRDGPTERVGAPVGGDTGGHSGVAAGPPGDHTAESDELLTSAVAKAVEETGGYAGSVFLRSHDRRSLVLVAACGSPPSLLGGWRLIPVNSPIPIAAAYRSGRTVHLADGDASMRRFPQLAVALPYAFGSATVPVRAGREIFGALAVVWAAPPGTEGLTKTQLRHLRATAGRLGAGLDALRARGHRVEYDAHTVVLEVPATATPSVRVGLFDWRLDTGALAADDELCAIFGLDPARYDGRAATLASRIHPGDLAAFRAAARAAVQHGRVLARRLRVRGGDDRLRTVELWGRVPEDAGEAARSHLVGAVLDPGAGSRAVAAVERLHDGVVALDPDGRITYVNHGLERLLGIDAADVLGLRLWDVLPWLADPGYENRHRAAMVSQQPTSFLARRPPDQWLTFVLHPAADGVTARVAPADRPAPADAVRSEPDPDRERGPGPGRASGPEAEPEAGRGPESGTDPEPGAPTAVAVPDDAARPRLGAMYHLLQLGSALTEAVTAREVCAVVAEQVLAAFGGQHLAIFAVHDGRMRLLFRAGSRDDFLGRLEGATLDARLPGTETLTTGAPLFIESERQLAREYPDLPADGVRSWVYLPLIASSRPVGTCVLGFDAVHRLRAEQRSVLGALGGLIAQALERARLFDEAHAIARGLQHALLPHRLPALAGVRITGRYLPGTTGMDIGGDWYDAIPTGGGLALVIGDVEGHSVAAAALMGQLRSAVRAFATAGHRPSEVVAGTNRLMIDLDATLLASCCYLWLDAASGRIRAVRAGHCPPLLRHPDGTAEVLDLPGGAVLGVDPTAGYPETEWELAPGSVLALYTDGLVEVRDADIDLGVDRLRSSLAHARADSLEELADRLLQEARRSPDRADDIALLVTEYTPDRGPAAGL